MSIALDGNDLFVYGAVVPDLLSESTLGPPPTTQVGAIASYARSTGYRALTVCTLADLIGWRRVMFVCVTWFRSPWASAPWRPAVNCSAPSDFWLG
jgi:hypothetical protein